MDERKGFARSLVKYTVLASLGLFLLFGSYAGFVYWKTQTIENPKKCFTTKMYKVNLCPSNPQYVRFKQVPKHFFQALILSEDGSFYSHKGFDWFEIKESFRRNIVEWRFARGGSTLTQQLAKNLYLSKSKSLGRKFQEFFIARQIEKKLSKTQILEKYINVVEFGKKIYGLKPAARHYFSKSPSELNVLESVYLVSLLPSPVRLGRSYENKKLSGNNLWRMKIILKRMYRTGKITDEVYVYVKMLLEDTEWPFDHYSEGLFDPTSIEDQMFEEFEQLEDSDDLFDDSNNSAPEVKNSDEVYLDDQDGQPTKDDSLEKDSTEEMKIEPTESETNNLDSSDSNKQNESSDTNKPSDATEPNETVEHLEPAEGQTTEIDINDEDLQKNEPDPSDDE